MRKKPKNADWYDWEAFERWADITGIGDAKNDWIAWWECWKAAYSIAMQG